MVKISYSTLLTAQRESKDTTVIIKEMNELYSQKSIYFKQLQKYYPSVSPNQ